MWACDRRIKRPAGPRGGGVRCRTRPIVNATDPGSSAPTPATRRPRSRTSSTAGTWRRGRPGCRWPSTSRRRPATTRTTSSPAARSARSGCRSATSATCATLFDGIPLAEANTSMTINAPAMWLLALYVAVAEEQGADRAQLAGTTQNDIVKEYLSRGHLRLPARAQHAADHRHDRLVGTPTSRSGTRSTSAATTCRRPGRPRRRSWPTRCRRRSRCSTPSATPARSPPREFGRGRRAHLVLRQRRAPVRRGDVQDAGPRPALGRDHARALRRHGRRRRAGCATACRSTRWA